LGLPAIQWWWLIRCFLRSVQPEHLTTAHKRPTPRPRLEGDTHPAGENHPTAKPGRERPTPRSRPGRERPTPRPGLAVLDPNGLEVTRADLGLASPSSPNEFELAKKGSPEVELGLEVVEPCRLVAEKILVAEINLK
jgi:hypothetical protein